MSDVNVFNSLWFIIVMYVLLLSLIVPFPFKAILLMCSFHVSEL